MSMSASIIGYSDSWSARYLEAGVQHLSCLLLQHQDLEELAQQAAGGGGISLTFYSCGVMLTIVKS